MKLRQSKLALAWWMALSPTSASGELIHIADPTYPGFSVAQSTEGVSNADTRVAVGKGVFDFAFLGFLWQDGMLAPLGSPSARANAVSTDGTVIVGTSDHIAFRWEDGVLEELPAPSVSSEAHDVSADGRVIVGLWQGIDQNPIAVRWVDGVYEELGDLPGGSVYSTARSVSADGAISVGFDFSGQYREAFRWENGILTGLGDLPGGQFESEAHAISADGTTIVGEGNPGPTHAFRWTAAEGMIDLGELPGGENYSVGLDVSGTGRTIVGQSRGTEGDAAFVWDEANGMRRLVDVLRDQFGIDATALGWRRLTHANAISDDGRVIGGEGERLAPPAATAWMAVLPHPPGTFVCDVATGNSSYTNWEVVGLSVLRYANLDAAPLPARVRLQLTVPGGLTVDLVDAGGGGGIALPAGLDVDLGPVPLVVVQPWLPRGTYALRCALEDPVTGEMKTSGRSSFTLN